MAFLAAAHPVAFVPIRVISRGRSSHIHPVADSLRWWRWWRGYSDSRHHRQRPFGRDARVASCDEGRGRDGFR
jgi:hypothetical protein